jgi:hypothetical protein
MDPDAAAYITAVETADGQALEEKVKIAIDNFVLGCKADGIWSAIKASCILAGARTLAGALVPLVGTAPTNYNFVAGDYNRETGLVGDGSTKYLNANRNHNSDPQNSSHIATYSSTIGTSAIIGHPDDPNPEGISSISAAATRSRNLSFELWTPSAGFLGISRSISGSYARRTSNATSSVSTASLAPPSSNVLILRFGLSYGTSRLAFYSIGEALDLQKLDARVTDLINAFGVAIP